MRRCLSWAFVLLYCLAALSPLSHRTSDAGPPGWPDGSEPHPGFLYLELILDRCLPDDDDDDAPAPLVILKKKRAVLRHDETGPLAGEGGGNGIAELRDSGPAPGRAFSKASGPATLLTRVLLSHLASGLSPPHSAS